MLQPALHVIVDLNHVNKRLDFVLPLLFPKAIHSRSHAAQLVKCGHVSVNGKKEKVSYKIEAQDQIACVLPRLTPQKSVFLPKTHGQEHPGFDVLFEDMHILVIDKHAGLVVHKGAGHTPGPTLVDLLHQRDPHWVFPSLAGPERAGLVHRLDKGTTGVMVVAKTLPALLKLNLQFSKHLHKRIYHAFIYGIPTQSEGKIETLHGRDPKNRLRFAVVPNGKPAAMHYAVLRSVNDLVRASKKHGAFSKQGLSLVQCQLETGRTHQIRVQLAHRGHPIVGDSLYAPHQVEWDKKLSQFLGVLPPLTRPLLHAWQLGLQHPITGADYEWTAPYPKDFGLWLEHV